MATLTIEGKKVKVDDSFLSLSPEEQEATVDEIADSMGLRDQSGLMGQLNQGIANAAGGIIDLLNPFDPPHSLNPFGQGTGSAVTGLEMGMDAIGVNRATSEPDTFVENLARGAGEAAGAAPFGGAAAKALSGAGGMIGGIADDASTAMNSTRGFVSELFAGAGAQGAQSAAEDAGAPEWLQLTAGLIGGAGVGAIPGLVRSTPSAIGARKLTSAVKTATMPYTSAGGREVARQRLQELAGGADRAEQLAREIGPTEIGLSPAQQTGDPNLLALEQEAMRRNPKLRAEMDARAETAQQAATDNVRGMGGNPTDTQTFFDRRRADFRSEIMGVVDRVTGGALRPKSKNSEIINSQEVADQIKAAQDAAKAQESALWGNVPKGTQVGTTRSRQVAQELIAATPRAQRDDIPRVVQELLGPDSNSAFGEFETVSEMHGLYSKLRETARAARSGTNQQRNLARISDEIADAILEDLGAGAGQTSVGRTIDEARAFSAEMHQIFDQGIVGRLMKQSVDGDRSIDPALTLDRSVGRSGSQGAINADGIRAAAGSGVDSQIEDFLKGRFDRAAFGADGKFNPKAGRTFMRDNADMMERFPGLKDTFDKALGTQTRAASVTARKDSVLTNMDNPSKSQTAAFNAAPAETAIDAVFKAKKPSVAARELAATARKDKSGKALDGLKGSFADYVIRSSTDVNGLNGDAMLRFLSKPENVATLRSAMPEGDVNRMRAIARELKKLRNGRKAAPDIGGLSPRSPNRVIEYVARIVAANQGAKAGKGAASLQTAQMASGRMKALLGNLQNDKAEQMLIDAVTDPELFRLLLVDPGSVKLAPVQVNRLAPYFTGAGAALATPDQDGP